MSKAIVLLSGGQDSTTCLYWAKKNFEEVYAVGFDYGQMHRIELEQAQKIANRASVPYKIFDVKGLLAPSSLTEHSDHNEKSKINSTLPASFTAGRNLLFLTIASSYGASMHITDLVTGVCQTDYSGYPDCRRTTIDSLQLSFSL
jgi:7-cyano-7-deazaguanine synthase